MTATLSSSLATIGYVKARRILVAVGLIVLLILAGLLYVRRVDAVEVIATLLFIPIFLGFIFWRAKGGVIMAILASAIYLGLRMDAVEAIGFSEFAGLITSRMVAFLVFGLVGGWANQTLELSLDKLDLYDQIDDATGLFNARFFVQDSDLEIARSKRYQTLFSIAIVDVPVAVIEAQGGRKAKSTLRELGRQLAESVRTVDRVVHAREGDVHHFVAVLPETSAEGAAIFSGRFGDGVHQFLAGRGVTVDRSQIVDSTMTVPGDDDALQALRERYAALDSLEHEHAIHA